MVNGSTSKPYQPNIVRAIAEKTILRSAWFITGIGIIWLASELLGWS